MRALRFDGRAVALDASATLPEPAPGEALIRVTKGAIARLDLDAAQPGSGFTGTLGHEFVGVVERIGSEASTPAQKKSAARGSPAPPGAALVGKRVVAPPLASCGVCERCARGLAWHCAEATLRGLRGREGSLAGRILAPALSLTHVPDSVDDDAAVFAGAVAQALHNAQHAAGGFRAGPPRTASEGAPHGALVTVIGDGPIALLTAQALAPRAPGVRIVGRHERNLALCEKWGVGARHERDSGRRADQDVVVDCSGSASGFALACAMVRPRGRLVFCSRWAPTPCDLRPVVDAEIEVVGSRGGSVGEAIAALASGAFDVASLISGRRRLDDALAAWRDAQAPGALRVLVTV